MNSTQWYSASLRATGVFCILFFALSYMLSCFSIYLRYYFLKYVFYRQIPQFLRGPSRITWFEAIMMLIFLTGNVVCVAIGSRDSTVIRRLAIMSIVNLVPLALGGHMNFIASRCRIRPQKYERMHRWVGKVAILEGLIHSVMAALSNVPSRRSPPAIVAAVVVAVLSICSNVFIRRYFYEAFLNLHLILAGVLFITLWFHTRSGKVLAVPKIYILAAACLWFLAQILRLLNRLYRSPPHRTQTNRATVMEMPGAFHICVKLVQPWKFRAGEYVYLTLPGLSLTARFQSHPAVVAWWYKSEDEKSGDAEDEEKSGDAEDEEKSRGAEGEKSGGAVGEGSHLGRPDTIVLIVRPRSGATQGYFTPVNFPEGYLTEGDFTNGLRRVSKVANWKTMLDTNFTSEVNGCLCNSIEQPIRMKAIIEGPYGEELELGQYGTVLLFATGVGISPQIAYTRRLLEKYHKWDSKIQRIALFWELESETHGFWVKHWMNDLLEMDTNYILDIRLFILGDYITSPFRPEKLGRLEVARNPLDVERVMTFEIENRKGQTLVSTCVHEKMADEIRTVLAGNLDKKIRLHESSFDPPQPTSSQKPPRSLLRQIENFLRQLF